MRYTCSVLNKLSALTLMLVIASHAVWADEHSEKGEEDIAKVVFHADFADPRRFSAMLTSINNMVMTYENELMDYDVRIVLLSQGIRFVTTDKLKGTPFEEDKALAESRKNLMTRLNSLREVSGVKLALCEITRAAVGLDKEKIMPGVEMVPSGVVEVARLQSEGFSYLKAD
jgi:intracellular sulfur oxidation DsrE/DsrF family protein